MLQIVFYPIYLALAFIVTLLVIPRKHYKEYFIYGLIIGALGDGLIILLMQNVLGVMWFQNLGFLEGAFGQPFLSPPSWLLTVMIFLRFLPRRRIFIYLHIASFAFFSTGYAYVVRQVGLYDFKPWLFPYVGLLIFMIWWGIATYVFLKTSPLAQHEETLP